MRAGSCANELAAVGSWPGCRSAASDTICGGRGWRAGRHRSPSAASSPGWPPPAPGTPGPSASTPTAAAWPDTGTAPRGNGCPAPGPSCLGVAAVSATGAWAVGDKNGGEPRQASDRTLEWRRMDAGAHAYPSRPRYHSALRVHRTPTSPSSASPSCAGRSGIGGTARCHMCPNIGVTGRAHGPGQPRRSRAARRSAPSGRPATPTRFRSAWSRGCPARPMNLSLWVRDDDRSGDGPLNLSGHAQLSVPC
jgi:hypothetical protein